MDILFIILSIILIIIIVAVYVLNNVPITSDITTLFKNIVKLKPSTTSFCIGKKKGEKNLYRNAVTNSNGNVIIKEDQHPIGLDGEYIILKDHGTIIENGDGYKMSGMEMVNFKCPNGYTGINCTLIPICEPNDVGKIKPLTYTQFNSLGLYANTISAYKRKTLPSTTEPTHPRIRVQCLTDTGEYKLETCPDNRLLDDNLICQPYDICEDHMNGYKHNFKLHKDDLDLANNEYYICQNNVSVKTQCINDTIFSSTLHGCITESICFNRGNDTIRIDDKSYVQCENDMGKKIECETHVIENDGGVLSCFIPTCSPVKYEYNDAQLKYVYGEVTCVNDVAETKMCDNTPEPRVYSYKWAEPFQYTIENWPKEVLVNNKCVTPTDDIIANPIINLAWSNAMPASHPFNLITQEYICDPTYKYRWDYLNNTLIPNNNDGEIVNSAAPCQNDLVNSPITFENWALPLDSVYIFRYEPTHLPSYKNIHLWPIINKRSKKYFHTRCTYDAENLNVTTYVSDNLPLGFSNPPQTNNLNSVDNYLRLNGYPKAPIKNDVQYYFIATGTLELVKMNEPKIEYHEQYKLLKRIDTTKNVSFAIDWSKITNTLTLFDGLVTLDSKHITIDGDTIAVGFSVFKIQFIKKGKSIFHFSTLSVSFDNEKYPTISFP